jgi:hypothetical protein
MLKYAKRVIWLSIATFVFASFTACFGKFPLIRKLYSFNESIADKGTLLGRFINNLVYWVMLFFPIYGIAGLIDGLIFNLIEFWTGNQILTNNTESKGDRGIAYQQSEDGNSLSVTFRSQGEEKRFHFFKNQPGRIFTQTTDGYYTEISLNAELDRDLVRITSVISGETSVKAVPKLSVLEMERRFMNIYTAAIKRHASERYASAETSAVY